MTVRELIEELEQFDEDEVVCIGMFQNYGTDFVMEIAEIEAYGIHNWDDRDDDHRVILVEGRQFGSISDEDE